MVGFVIPEDDLRAQAAKDGITHLVTGIAIERAGKLLAIRRDANDYLGGQYELPGGGVDGDETLAEAVTRETLEETGLTVTNIVAMFAGFDYTTPNKPKARQFNFLVKVEGGEVVLSPEHDQAAWVDEATLATTPMTDEMRQCFIDAFAAMKAQP